MMVVLLPFIVAEASVARAALLSGGNANAISAIFDELDAAARSSALRALPPRCIPVPAHPAGRLHAGTYKVSTVQCSVQCHAAGCTVQ